MSIILNFDTKIPDELADEFVKRLCYVSEGIQGACLLAGGDRVSIQVRPGFQIKVDQVEASISDVASKLCQNHRNWSVKTLARQDRLPSTFHGDPHTQLIEQGELIPFGRGRYGFGPKVAALMEYFDLKIRTIAASHSAQVHIFPSLIGADALHRCRYLRNFPATLNLVTHLREDHGSLKAFSLEAHLDGDNLVCDREAMSQVECLLSPTVCFHYYMALRDSSLAKPLAVTAVGKCFRYESSNLTGLERLWDFTMREIVFVGPEDYVLNSRQRLIEDSAQFLRELELAFEIATATDPFFVDNYSAQAAYQSGFDLKFELLAELPYSGKKIAAGSINYHQDYFGRCFGIDIGGSAAHTACIGFGLERLTLAFLSQHGLDHHQWPEIVTKAL
jgi:seryl-tRNA synthetase